MTKSSLLSILGKSAASLCALLLLSASTASAQSNAGPSIDQQLQELEQRQEGFESFGWPATGRFPNRSDALKRYVAFNKKMWDKHRIGWQFTPTLMFQGGTQGGPDDFTGSYQHNILFYWRPVQNSSWGNGAFVANILQVRQITSTTGVDFTRSLGISYPVSDSVTDTNAVKGLYWQQDFPGDIFNIQFGQIELNGIILNCSYTCDDTTSFMASPLSTNVTSTMAAQGLGLRAGVNFNANLKFEFGVTDGNGNGQLHLDRGVDLKELAYGAAFVGINLFPSLGAGAIRLGYYMVDPTKQGTPNAAAGTSGIVLNIEQDVGDFGLFARYSATQGRQAAVGNSGIAGFVWKNPFSNAEDQLGVGLAYVQPTAANSKTEYVTEAFYRMQITPLAQLSAGVMLLTRPNNAANTGTEAVFNMRLRAAF